MLQTTLRASFMFFEVQLDHLTWQRVHRSQAVESRRIYERTICKSCATRNTADLEAKVLALQKKDRRKPVPVAYIKIAKRKGILQVMFAKPSLT